MNTTQQGIILLLKSAITGEKYSLPEGFDLEAALPEIDRHKVHTLAFQGAANCGLPGSHPVMRQLFQKYCRSILISEGQMREIRRICRAFDENGIDYMPLKGCNMKARYPKPELRIMGDADILIRMEQYEMIEPIMKALGFAFKCESDHELIWQSDSLYLELHKRLIPSYQKDLSPYFSDCWTRAGIAAGNCCVMTPEDEWLYLFTHFAKHCRDSGIGCRHVADLWVFLRTYPGLNDSYVKRALGELRLLEFYENILHLIRVWFEEETPDGMSGVLTAYIFASGSWGDMSTRVLSVGVRDGGQDRSTAKSRLGWVRAVVFPGVQTLKGKYTVLQKAPWLLPGVWAVRPFYKLLREREDVEKRSDQLRSLTREKLDARQQALRYVGLDYNF